MPEENSSEQIVGPTPVKSPAGSTLLTRVIIAAAATVGGFMIFAPMLAPTCVKGATRSAKLKWEHRQRDIQTAIAEAALRGDLPESTTSADAPTATRTADGSNGPK